MFRLHESIRNGHTYMIAEMSANHGGSFEHALEIIKGAAAAGADCLKIQTYTADSLTIDCDKKYFKIDNGGLWDGKTYYELYKEAGTPYEWQADIKRECERLGMDFLSTPFDRAGVDFLEDLGCEAIKIASFELVDIPLISYAASKKKTMIISCGMGSLEEIKEAVDACLEAGNDDIVLLKCCSEYPAPWEDMHLGNIPDMMERFKLPVGLSDHSEGFLGAVVGVSLGACVVEKHVKLEGVESADDAFSMTLSEYAGMVQAVRAAEKIKKGPDYSLSRGEENSLVYRRSLFAVKDIKKGDVITEENVRSIRPGNGIKPVYLKDMLGKPCPHDIERGEPVTQKIYLEIVKKL